MRGLVNVEDDEFENEWQKVQEQIPAPFAEWMKSTKGRLRSHVDTIHKCMLRSVRIHAGLGNPPNKYDTQRNEFLNNVIKEELERKAVDQTRIHDLLKESGKRSTKRNDKENLLHGRISFGRRV